jgi:hypothetical protein
MQILFKKKEAKINLSYKRNFIFFSQKYHILFCYKYHEINYIFG